MNYQGYVIAAYAVFVIAMLWDWLSPQLQIRRNLRIAKLHATRNGRKSSQSSDRHPGERRDPF